MEEVDDYVPISALQHLAYCERQAALIQIERVWEEDAATASGRVLHTRVDLPGVDSRAGVRSVRGMVLVSHRLGLRGRADVVEFEQSLGAGERATPVEYKRGGAKARGADRIQLAAQAMCLEEMFACHVAEGALFYATTRKREVIAIDDELRLGVARAIERFNELRAAPTLPPPVYGRKCEGCSLAQQCLPRGVSDPRRGSTYIAELIAEVEGR